MPLEHGTDKDTFRRNVREMVKAGHPVKQAVAAAYREMREGKRKPKPKGAPPK